MDITKYDSRKLWLALLLLALASVSMFLHIATFAEYTSYCIWIFGTYAASNVGDKVTDAISKP